AEAVLLAFVQPSRVPEIIFTVTASAGFIATSTKPTPTATIMKRMLARIASLPEVRRLPVSTRTGLTIGTFAHRMGCERSACKSVSLRLAEGGDLHFQKGPE